MRDQSHIVYIRLPSVAMHFAGRVETRSVPLGVGRQVGGDIPAGD